MVTIREERPGDVGTREALIDAAFGDARRTKTCERLREGRVAAAGLSLVAILGGRVVGTVRFWHVQAGDAGAALMLGPLVVDPAARGRGAGAALVREGLMRARRRGYRAVLLVGDAPYYERFGFAAACAAALTLPGPYAPERFLALALVAGALDGAAGPVQASGARERPLSFRRMLRPARPAHQLRQPETGPDHPIRPPVLWGADFPNARTSGTWVGPQAGAAAPAA